MRRPRPATMRMGSLPAPVGGLNTVDAGGSMPATDASWAINLVAADKGLRVRLGWREWVTGVTGAIGTDEVRGLLPFAGNGANGSGDRLFAVHPEGIWNVSDSTTTPTKVATFANNGGRAGFGTSVVMSTSAGRFLLYCDEENGLWIYTESTALWAQITIATAQAWAGTTDYLVGNTVTNGGNEYACTTAGESAGSGGPTGTGTGITDGTVVWDYVAAAQTSVIGPGLADQQNGYSLTSTSFAHVAVWKNRVWLTERNSSRAWYLAVNAIYGTASAFDFGPKMRAGGPLRGLYNWSYDGGSGLDTLLVGVSGAGDVVIYQGTDPDSVNTFGLKGAWYVGAVPEGRNIAVEYGGELLVLSLIGVVPLSKLVVGTDETNAALYPTRKVANLFNELAAARRGFPGWALHVHPQDNALVVIVPTSPGQKTEQLVMSFGTGGWFRWMDMGGGSQQPPIYSACVWGGELWFGTPDGRVCIQQGAVDGVTLADVDAWTDIYWSVCTAFSNLGRPTQKQVGLLLPMTLGAEESPAIEAHALYDFDTRQPAVPSATPSGGWDSGLWDSAVWDGGIPSQSVQGAVGMGRYVAAAVRGKSRSRTTLVAVDITFTEGGVL